MPRISLDSERPIMAPSAISSKRASMRFSTYSTSPSFNSLSTLSSDSGMQEIKQLSRGLERLENKPLSEQRFVPSEAKKDSMSKVSLGAKVERALSRRMSNQDYVRKDPGATGLGSNSEKKAIVT